MTIQLALRRVDAKPCTACRGRGHALGVFHRLTCLECAGVGYVQALTGQPLDTLAAAIIADAAAVDARAARLARLSAPNAGSPDNWILRGNFRGD